MIKNEMFYQYDLYAIEQEFPKQEFVQVLENSSQLCESIDPFLISITDSLYNSISKDETIKLESFSFPELDATFEDVLKGNNVYHSYKSQFDNSLSRIVFEKFVKRIFQKDGFNDETHIIQDYLQAWLERRLARSIARDDRFDSLEVLKSLLDKTEMLHHEFYCDLVENIPESWVLGSQEKWTNIFFDSNKILDGIRTFDVDLVNSYSDYVLNLSRTNLWQFVQDATRNSDYLSLKDDVSFISSVLIKKRLTLWIEFWDNLKYPIIQDCVFTSAFDFIPQTYIELANMLADDSTAVVSDKKVLLLIIAQNYFKISIKLTERFSVYSETERKSDENKSFFEEGFNLQKQWLATKVTNYKTLIQTLTKQLSNEEIENWIFSYKPRTNCVENKSNKIYDSEIKLLATAYKGHPVELSSLNIQSFNLQKFNFYIDVIKEKSDNAIGIELLDMLINHVSSNDFYWNVTCTEPYCTTLKGMGYLLGLHDNPIERSINLINTFKVNHQGWNPVEIDYRPLVKEVFILSGVINLFENDCAFSAISEKEELFKRLLYFILEQDRFSCIDNSKYYQFPLQMLYSVSNQISTNMEIFFERELINNYDNLYSLLTILSKGTIRIQEETRNELEKRLKMEYSLLKKQFNNRHQSNMVYELEQMVDVLTLNNI